MSGLCFFGPLNTLNNAKMETGLLMLIGFADL